MILSSKAANRAPAKRRLINPKSLERQAAESIRSSILAGDYVAGSRLTETRVSNDLGLSRGTIRGALQQLTHEGLVTLSPYRGWSVASLSAKDAWEIYTLRNVLEGLASKILAENIPSSRAEEIHQRFNALKVAVKTGQRDQIIRSDFEFHRTIIELSGHSRLLTQYKIIESQMLMFFAMAGAFVQLKDYVNLHAQIVDAIVSKNPELAQKLASNHNTVDGNALVNKLRGLEERNSNTPAKKKRRSRRA